MMCRKSGTWTHDRDCIGGHGARLCIRLNHVNLFSVRRAVLAFEESINSYSFVEARKPASCVA